MRVYVETNFVLELVLEQEQTAACEQIASLAEAGRLTLVLPAFCLAEPFETLERRKHERAVLVSQMERHLREVGRTATLKSEVEELTTTARTVLTRSAEEADRRFDTVTSRLLAMAELLPLTSVVLRDAAQHRKAYGLSLPDALVLASVLGDLSRRSEPPAPSCFLNRNHRDFGDPSIVATLEAHLCKTLLRFDAGLAFLQRKLSP